MASREGRGSGEGSGDARAAQSVPGGSAFRTAASARAETASGAMAQRWAPDGAGAERAPAMRALRFADRHLTAYLGAGHPMRGRRVDRAVPSVNWLFPIPWFGDELDWMSAARAATQQSVRAAYRAGEIGAMVAPRPAERGARGEAARERAAEATRADRPVGFGLPVELVAPSFALARSAGSGAGVAGAGAASGSGAEAQMRAAWRAYSPMVDGAAARAAELLAELAFRSRSADEGQPAGRRQAPLLAFVTPTELAGGGGRDAGAAAQLAEAARRELEQRRAAAAVRRAAQVAGAAGAGPAAGAASSPAAVEAGAAARAPSSAAAAEAARAAAAQLASRGDSARAVADAGRESGAAAARAQRIAAAAGAGQGAAGFAPSDDPRALAGAAAGAGPVPGSGAMAGGALAGAQLSASERALELLAEGLASGWQQRVSPSAGPRVLMPAGLGGFLAASAAARAVERPAGRTPGGAPVGAEPGGPVAGTRPAALDHVLWADRWLARFAGASPAALRSFETARSSSAASSSALFAPSERWRATDWSPAWVAPTGAPAGLAPSGSAAVASGARAASGSASATPSSVIVDEDERVSDDVFGAIAASAAAERARASDLARVRAAASEARAAAGRGAPGAAARSAPVAPVGPAALVGPFRTPLADRALAGFSLGGSPGLAASLAASPLASILAGLLDLAPQAAFDARPLSLAALGEIFSRGAQAARWSAGWTGGDESVPESSHAALLRRLAGRAPASVWLSLPEPGTGAERAAANRGGHGQYATHGGTAGEAAEGASPSVAGAATQAGALAGTAGALSGGAAGVAAPGVAASAGAAASTGSMAAWMSGAGPMAGQLAAFLSGPLAGHVAGSAGGLFPGPAASLAMRAGEAPRPGDVATRAESFADARTVAASDLALDFLSPELLAAARAAGMGPIEAGRAQRLAASGRPYLMALAMAVDRVFVEALSPGRAGASTGPIEGHAASSAATLRGAAHAGASGHDAAPAPGSAAAPAGAGAGLPAAQSAAAALERAAPARVPRGAFLLPDAAARALGVPAASPESLRPSFAAALDLVAASHVADAAAAWRPGAGDGFAAGPGTAAAIASAETSRARVHQTGAEASAAPPGTEAERIAHADVARAAQSEATQAAGVEATQAAGVQVAQAAAAQAAAARAGVARDEAAAWSGQVAAARAQLPRELWPVFDAVYVSLGESPDTRPLAPSARAARALALASRSAAGPAALSARARAAAAWAVLPVLVPGGATFAGRSAASPPASASASSRSSAVARAGDALGALVAPSMLVSDAPADRASRAAWSDSARAQAWSGRVEAPFIETGTSRPAPPPPAPSPPPPRPPERAVSESDMAWFQEAARKYLGEAGPASGGISVAEMTLVTAAPRAQIAASPVSAGRAVTQASSTTPTGGDGSKQDVAVAGRPDVDKIAQEVFEQICRMMAVARERSGDPWQR